MTRVRGLSFKIPLSGTDSNRDTGWKLEVHMNPRFEGMTRQQLKAYVLTHRDDAEAVRALMTWRSPDETATWYRSDDLKEMEQIFKRKINDEPRG